jgi:hypothetical protein
VDVCCIPDRRMSDFLFVCVDDESFVGSLIAHYIGWRLLIWGVFYR